MIFGNGLFADVYFGNSQNGAEQASRWIQRCPTISPWQSIAKVTYNGVEQTKTASTWEEIPKDLIGVTKCL